MFFKVVHFYGSLHINQAPLLFRHSEVGGDPHIQKQNFVTLCYPRGEYLGIGKQPNIPCIHFYLTFFALLDQKPCSVSLNAPPNQQYSIAIFSRVPRFQSSCYLPSISLFSLNYNVSLQKDSFVYGQEHILDLLDLTSNFQPVHSPKLH